MSTPTVQAKPSDQQDRKRKEHHSSGKGKPSSSSSSGHKPPNYHMWRKDANDFLCIPQFNNNLPNVPSGPFFKNIELLHPYSDFGVYKMSSLEKNYIWQPHCGPDVGLKLDLVDQDAILIPDNSEDFLDPAELRYLTSASDTRKSKSRMGEVTEKPWWLRNTTYLENDLYKTRQRPDSEQQAKRLKRGKEVGEEEEEELAGDSFAKLGPTLEKLRARVFKEKKVTIEWEIPILPSEEEQEGDLTQTQSQQRQFAIVHYDEHPDVTLAAAAAAVATTTGSSENGDADDEEREAAIKLAAATAAGSNRIAVNDSVILNLRKQLNEQHKEAGGNTFGVSLVGPAPSKGGGVTAAAEGAGGSSSSEGGELYSWIRDYRMEFASTNAQDVFIFTIKPGSHGASSASASASASASSYGGGGGCVRYFPARMKAEMRKLAVEAPHEAVITRSSSNAK